MAFVAFNFIMPDGSPMIYFIEGELWDGTLDIMRSMASFENFLEIFDMKRCDPYAVPVVQRYEVGLRAMLPQIHNPALFLSGYFLATVLQPDNSEELWKRAYTVVKMPDVFEPKRAYEAYLIASAVIYNEVSLEHHREEPWHMN